MREHLTGPELEALLLEEPSGEEARAHCEECSQCAALVRTHRAALREIKSLNHLIANSERLDCPPQEQWLNLAAGLTQGAEAMKLLEHAAQCRACAQLLRESQQYLAATPDEALDLKSSTPEWQRKMAEKMAVRPAQTSAVVVRQSRSGRKWWFYVPVAAASAAALLFFVFRVWFLRPNIPQLLASAYSQRRTLEPRIPGAAYADWHEERSSGQESVVSSQDPIEKPAAAIRDLCREAPENDDCLIYGAQLDLLAGRYKPALAALGQVKGQSDSKSFLLVRAQAEFEKGDIEGETRIYTSSYGQAIEDLSKVLTADPHNAVALFNRALAYERLQSFKAAASDWQELLKVEKDPGWVAEAKRHLEAIQEKERTRLEHLKLLYDPQQSYRGLEQASRLDPVHSEAYFETAVEHWIPPATAPAGVAHSALEKLALALQQNHHDSWLLDFLNAPSTPQAVTLLRSAISANNHGDPTNAAKQAQLAEALFQQAGNFAGIARSRFEFIYAQHRQFNAAECLRSGLSLRKGLDRHAYAWLRIELLLEIFGCQLMSSSFDPAQGTVDEAIRQAEVSQYPVLQLRAASFKTSSQRTEGQFNSFWTEIQKELAVFWSGGFYPPKCGYQFYADLDLAAEEAGEWRLAEGFQWEALNLIEGTEREDLKAYAHFRLAEAAQLAGELLLARQEFERARRIFQQLPQTEATRRFEADAAITLASIEVAGGRVEPAKYLIAEARPQLAGLNSFLPQLSFSLVNAEVARSEQRWDEEQRYLHEAAAIGNDGYKTIHSQQERWKWRQRMETVYKRLLEIELRADHEPAQAMAKWEMFRAAEVRGGVPISAIGSNTVRDELLQQTAKLQDSTVVAFVVLPENIQVWIADNRGIEERSISIAAHDLDQKVQAFYRLCSSGQSSIARQKELGVDLYQLLLGPVQTKLDPRRTLLIEADGPLASLPWPALLMPNGRYLGGEYSLAGTPGLFYHSTNLPDVNGQPEENILVAVPGPVTFENQELNPLPQAEGEAQSLLHLPARSVWLRGKDASLTQLKKYLPQATIFHFAGHAVGFEHGGELILAGVGPGNMLTAATISGLHLSGCRLVVLSACSTALVGQDILHNPDGLVQAFLKSGAERVIASHWDVDSEATAAFMHALYQSLEAGESVPQAVRDARRHILANPRMAVPYYWASFELFGGSGVYWSSPAIPNIPSAREQRLALR